jgi:uncharacterized GH25 family protein
MPVSLPILLTEPPSVVWDAKRGMFIATLYANGAPAVTYCSPPETFFACKAVMDQAAREFQAQQAAEIVPLRRKRRKH